MMETYLICGLGNPDRKYEKTRHNAGWQALDELAALLRVRIGTKKFDGLTGETFAGGKRLLLLKPLTYMNNSGIALRKAADYYHLDPAHVIVLSDDINLDCGRLRIRGHGSAGGHNGLKSIIEQLGSEGFIRIRIGVGGVKAGNDLIDHVLGAFDKTDGRQMEKAYEETAQAVLYFLENGLEKTMNRYNSSPQSQAERETKSGHSTKTERAVTTESAGRTERTAKAESSVKAECAITTESTVASAEPKTGNGNV